MYRKVRCGWEGNINTDLTEIGWEPVNWINLATPGKEIWYPLYRRLGVPQGQSR